MRRIKEIKGLFLNFIKQFNEEEAKNLVVYLELFVDECNQDSNNILKYIEEEKLDSSHTDSGNEDNEDVSSLDSSEPDSEASSYDPDEDTITMPVRSTRKRSNSICSSSSSIRRPAKSKYELRSKNARCSTLKAINLSDSDSESSMSESSSESSAESDGGTDSDIISCGSSDSDKLESDNDDVSRYSLRSLTPKKLNTYKLRKRSRVNY